MRIPFDKFFPVRRDATVPTTVYVTQVATAASSTISSPLSTVGPTSTVLVTITAGAASAGASSIATTVVRTSFQSVPTVSSTSSSVSTVSGANSATSSSPSNTPSASSPSATSLAMSTPISSLLGSSSSSSTRLGLAIGIPIAVVSIFGLVVFILIYLKKRVDPKHTDTLAFKAKKDLLSKPMKEKYSASSEYSSSDIEQGYDHDYDPRAQPVIPRANNSTGQKPNFLKRISRLMTVPESPLEFKSPLFLRRFHLSSTKNEVDSEDSAEKTEKELPRSPLSKNPYNASAQTNDFPQREESSKPVQSESRYVVVKPYARRLGDELTVCVGEKVTIAEHHSDGWATVKLAESGEIGVIPLMCIKKFMGK